MTANQNNLVDPAAPITAAGFQIAAGTPRRLVMTGELAMRDPVGELGPALRKIHEAAAGGGEVVIDVTGLNFVNSSGLRLFLDWITWLAAEPPERRYALRFLTSKTASWQAVAFPAITSLGQGLVTAEPV